MYFLPPDNEPTPATPAAPDTFELSLKLAQQAAEITQLRGWIAEHEIHRRRDEERLRQFDERLRKLEADRRGIPDPRDELLHIFKPGAVLIVPDALEYLGIPNTPAAQEWFHAKFQPLPACGYFVTGRREVEAFSAENTEELETVRAQLTPNTPPE
jgi:uncharacterized coiled-coil protein SlyX